MLLPSAHLPQQQERGAVRSQTIIQGTHQRYATKNTVFSSVVRSWEELEWKQKQLRDSSIATGLMTMSSMRNSMEENHRGKGKNHIVSLIL